MRIGDGVDELLEGKEYEINKEMGFNTQTEYQLPCTWYSSAVEMTSWGHVGDLFEEVYGADEVLGGGGHEINQVGVLPLKSEYWVSCTQYLSVVEMTCRAHRGST
jgi:hypothetical protein